MLKGIYIVVVAMFGIAWAVGLISALLLLIYSIMMTFQFNDHEEAFSRKTIWNPMNVIFSPDLLNDRGKQLRKRALRYFFILTVALAVAGLIGLSLTVLDRLT